MNEQAKLEYVRDYIKNILLAIDDEKLSIFDKYGILESVKLMLHEGVKNAGAEEVTRLINEQVSRQFPIFAEVAENQLIETKGVNMRNGKRTKSIRKTGPTAKGSGKPTSKGRRNTKPKRRTNKTSV